MKTKLTPKQEKFAREFVKTGNACDSYRAAYNATNMSVKSIGRKSCELKSSPTIATRIDELQQAASKRAEISAADVLKIWAKIATANPNELVQVRRICCSKCYDQLDNKIPQPNPGCIFCNGEGMEHVYVADTTKLTGAAKLLYGGVRRTKHGAELILRNQDSALTNIAKFLGMFEKMPETTKLNSTPSPINTSTLPKDPNEAARIYQQVMKG